jgi:acyl-CoA thioesterase-1
MLFFPILNEVRPLSFFCCALLLSLGLSSCSKKVEEKAAEPPPLPTTPAPPDDPRPKIVCFGDSITAGFGLEPGQTYPDILQKLIDAKGYKYKVINAGISGETTQGGLDRLNDVVSFNPSITLLELGGNDGLRGIDLTKTRDNLTRIAGRLEVRGSKILLLGVTLPRNFGRDYINDFEKMYKNLATSHKYAYMPFILEGVWNVPGAMQADMIHPTPKGAEMVANNVFKYLEPLLSK